MKKFASSVFVLSSVSLPFLALAAGPDCAVTNKGDVTGIINFVTCTLLDAVLPLLVTLAVVGFVYGIIQYFLNPDNEEKKKAGKTFMLWGIVGLFVIVSIWGLVNIFAGTFGVDTAMPSLPQ